MIEKFVPIQGYIVISLVKEEDKGLLYMPKSSDESSLICGAPFNEIKDDLGRVIKNIYCPKSVGYKLDDEHLLIASKDVVGFEVE
jgi:hypothetical protein